MPSARPCLRFGKKKEMLLMEEAKAPPPMPLAPARITKDVKLQFGSERVRPMPSIGTIAMNEFIVLCIRVPQRATRNVFTTRNVAPVKPAIAGSDDTRTCRGIRSTESSHFVCAKHGFGGKKNT